MNQNATAQPGVIEAVPPEYALRVSGSVRLVLVISLSSFVEPDDIDLLRHMRGSEAFAATLRNLHPQPPFGIDEAAMALERDAYTLRIFRSRLIYNHFFPTYRMAWDAGMREKLASSASDPMRWQRWTGRVRLTRNGLAVITLEQEIEDASLIHWAEHVLELPHQGWHPSQQNQWSLGMLILEAFIDSFGHNISVATAEGQRVIHFRPTASATHTLRLDRYVIYLLRRIECDGYAPGPEILKRDYAPTLAAFMEGTLVENEGQRRLPRFSAEHARNLVHADVSTWDEELCLFTGESALIYCPLLNTGLAYVGGPMGLDGHAYGSYWKGIIRGIEHMVAFRAEVQQAERRTTDLLGRIPALTRKIHDGELNPSDLALIDYLATGLADIFDNLPEQRSMAVSSSAFRADYVRQKFEALLQTLDIRETLELINTNVEQLSFFLSYYNDMRLQWQAQRTNTIGIVLGAIVLFMAISSFLADTFNVVDRLNDRTERDLLLTLLIGMVGLLILGLMARRAWKLIRIWRHEPGGKR